MALASRGGCRGLASSTGPGVGWVVERAWPVRVHGFSSGARREGPGPLYENRARQGEADCGKKTKLTKIV